MITPYINIIHCVLLILAITILIFPKKIFSRHSQHLSHRGDEDEAIHYSVLLAGILVWPLIWNMSMGYSSLKEKPILWFAFLWPIVLSLFQMYDYSHDRREDIEDVQKQRQNTIMGIKADGGTIISIAFAMGTIFLVMSRVGDDKDLAKGAKMTMVALLICIAFIVPTANFIDNNQKYTVWVRNSQRVFVTYATGFIMAALSIMFVSKKKPQLDSTTLSFVKINDK